MTDVAKLLPRLRSQMSRGQLILFTGAGFSAGAKNRGGSPLPSSRELRDLLLAIAYPGDTPDTNTTLGDAYSVGLMKDRVSVRELLATRLSVDSGSLPDYYAKYFDMPWHRIYTLNVDDLEMAAASRFGLRRTPIAISATNPELPSPGRVAGRNTCDVVHLNGSISDAPELLTFSERQYAERIAAPDSWYSRCAAEVRARPVIYVGTQLHENTLWQHIEMRRRQRVESEVLPPGSILVSCELPKARADMLAGLNVYWVEGSAESFARDVLEPISDDAAKGFVFLQTHNETFGRAGIPLVSEVSVERSTLDTEYLMGDEPHWSDLLSGRAAVRSSDSDLLRVAEEILEGRRESTVLAVTGTAGSGKSTALMRLALEISNRGVPVLWIDKDSRAAPNAIRKRVRETDGPLMLAMDDADLYGYQLTLLLRDLVPLQQAFLFAFGVRSQRLDSLLEPVTRAREITVAEHVVPLLSDDDIANLIGVLARHSRLGILMGASDSVRRKAFSEKCGRQLLVAMIEATSGERFEEKAANELNELSGLQQFVYAAVSLATTQRHFLTRDEVLLACAGLPGDPLDALTKLVARHLVAAPPPSNRHRARHRVIADIVFESLQQQTQLSPIIKGVAGAMASKIDLGGDHKDRVWRLLIRLINHDYLFTAIGIDSARDVYDSVEQPLGSDYHYWLQRGSLEVEHGDLRRAELFLNQARSFALNDYRVDTEYAYLLMRKAIEAPANTKAPLWIEGATELLEGVIGARGDQDYYPFHVLGSQGLSWSRYGPHSGDERRRLLNYYMNVVSQGMKRHPSQRDLRQLHTDLKRDYLQTAIPRS